MDEEKTDNGNVCRLGLFACSGCEKTFDSLAARIRHYSSEHLKCKTSNNNDMPAKLFTRRVQPVCKIPPVRQAVDHEEQKSSGRRKTTCELEREAEATTMASKVDYLKTSTFDTEDVTMVAIDPQGEKPSSCPYCPLMFSMCSTMKKHLETGHPMTESPIQSSHYNGSQYLVKLDNGDDDDGDDDVDDDGHDDDDDGDVDDNDDGDVDDNDDGDVDDNDDGGVDDDEEEEQQQQQQSEDPAKNIPTDVQTVESTNEKESSVSSETNSQDTNHSIKKQFTCFICKANFPTPESFKGHLLKSYKVTEETAACLIASFYHTRNNFLVEEGDSQVIKVDPDDIMIVSEIIDLATNETTSSDLKLLLGPDMKPNPSLLNTEDREQPAAITEDSTRDSVARDASTEDHGMERTVDYGEQPSSKRRRRSGKKLQPSGEKPYKCPHCPLTYYHDRGRLYHIKRKHPVSYVSKIRKSSRKKTQKTSKKLSGPEKSNLKPMTTPVKSRNRNTTKTSSRIEITARPSRSNAGSYVRSETDVIGEKCTLCFERFPSKDKLGSHLRSYHVLSDNAVISICDGSNDFLNSAAEESGESSTTQNHASPAGIKPVESQNGFEKDQKLLEDPMGQGEKDWNQSKDHQIFVIKQRKRKKTIYKCDLCSSVFCSKASATRHRRVHTGEKPYQCSLCSEAFGRSDKLKLHTQGFHGVKVRPSRKRKGMKAKPRQKK